MYYNFFLYLTKNVCNLPYKAVFLCKILYNSGDGICKQLQFIKINKIQKQLIIILFMKKISCYHLLDHVFFVYQHFHNP